MIHPHRTPLWEVVTPPVPIPRTAISAGRGETAPGDGIQIVMPWVGYPAFWPPEVATLGWTDRDAVRDVDSGGPK